MPRPTYPRTLALQALGALPNNCTPIRIWSKTLPPELLPVHTYYGTTEYPAVWDLSFQQFEDNSVLIYGYLEGLLVVRVLGRETLSKKNCLQVCRPLWCYPVGRVPSNPNIWWSHLHRAIVASVTKHVKTLYKEFVLSLPEEEKKHTVEVYGNAWDD